MINRIIFFALISLVSFGVMAQDLERCGIDAHTEHLISKNPNYAAKLQKTEIAMQQWMADHGDDIRAAGEDTYTIPVVVHVVWRIASQNISDAQIQSQIDILNKDFQRLNADTTDTPEGFIPIAGSLNIEFCLAQRDPDDNPTDGIVRVETSETSFSTDDNVKFNASGGSDQWDPDRYFNIWVCNLTGGLLGYGEFPTGGFSDTYGVVCDYQYFGDIGTATFPYNKGRTATHEVGHCFNLRHIWGDDGSSCGGSDLVDDTPNQANENYGCPNFPDYDACTDTGDGVMYMNYMDYTDDACMNIFTQGQVDRMWSAVNLYYPELLESNGCEAIDLLDYDAALSEMIAPSGLFCENTVTPEVIIQNFGDSTITSLELVYSVDGEPASIYNWTGTLTTLATTNVVLPDITVDEGIHTLTVTTQNPNGEEDLNVGNDTGEIGFSVFTTGTAVPITQGFEGDEFPPGGWSVKNNSGGITWERRADIGYESDASTWVNNYEYDDEGATDDLFSIPVDLTGISSPYVSFDVAYAYFKQGLTELIDALEVLVSTDCGETFTSVYYKEGEDLETRSPLSASFNPTSSQWRKDSIDISEYADEDFVTIVFRSITGYGNNLYLDNINIFNNEVAQSITSVNAENWWSAYPNPVNEQLIVQGTHSMPEGTMLMVDIQGKTVWEGQSIQFAQITIDVTQLPSGLYFVKLISNEGASAAQKILIQH